jgi:probable HAF family extracellular repeat protein
VVGCKTSATLGGCCSAAYGVSADGAVVVGESDGRAFRWTASGGMEDLNTTYASLLTNGSVLQRYAISPDGRYIVGGATTPPQGATKPSCWIPSLNQRACWRWAQGW